MSNIYKAIVYGPAGVQGSKCAFPHPKTGKIVMIESSKGEGKGRSWRQEMIKSMLVDQPEQPFDEAMFMWMRIYVSRPTSHYTANDIKRGLKASAPNYPKSGKDVDKIQRTIGDAAKIAKWVKDDSRIAGWNPLRVYTEDILEPERTEVMMYSLEQHGLGFIEKVMAKVTEGHPIHDSLVPA
jgi:Holliday junction resolvase RusA-like endonuclease